MAANFKAVVSVGSTGFSQLISSILSDQALGHLIRLHCGTLEVQSGTSDLPKDWKHDIPRNFSTNEGEITVTIFKFSDIIEEIIQRADLAICHAGAGSILSAIRPVSEAPPKLIIVPNDTLMDGHQSDLANTFKENGWALTTSPSEIVGVLARIDDLETAVRHQQGTLPRHEPDRIRSILDHAAGFL